jgi:hypothetical protein
LGLIDHHGWRAKPDILNVLFGFGQGRDEMEAIMCTEKGTKLFS